jgi:protein-tyrosine-phosphatase
MKHEINKYNLADEISVSSAGLFALEGSEVSEQVKLLLEEKKIFLTENKRALQISYEIADQADMIFVMTRSHLRQLLFKYPHLKSKTYLLKEFASLPGEAGDYDIDDPYGQSLEIYQNVLEEIHKSIKKIMQVLKEDGYNENCNRQ